MWLRPTVRERHETDGRFHPSAATASAAPFGRKQHAIGWNGAEPTAGTHAVPTGGTAAGVVPQGDVPAAKNEGSRRRRVGSAAAGGPVR